ncbi:alpha-(1-_3)-arabinofuranosyltransferase domain-containing protein [Corynebacterium mayonis]|uniref:alpha-(1->3)-arabinofuranosyltransferase domain-containing protein n=1 Tax=Corynebacterium mayonis TaxID=3062461 RepID=UPI003140A6AC
MLFTLVIFAQPPGRVAADTKFNLTQNPLGFLRQATHAYTDQFTLGQIQNQAYGYLFPQGPFFLLPFPDWVLQRLWWSLLVCLAFSGTLLLARRIGLPHGAAVFSAVLYAFSPRILTTLTAISSEAWPVALVPWTLVGLVRQRPNVAASLIPVALMGAVNATATIFACVPALVFLLWRRQARAAALWFVGAVLLSAWWIGPLLVLGRYSPPFTEFIESAFVTSFWLNPAEILRGMTSWSPFVDTERAAGFLLVAEPVFILATTFVAAIGVAGLARRDMPWRGFFVALFALGFFVLGTAHFVPSLYDGPLAPFRNLHKLDFLVRLPVVLGAGWALSHVRPPAVVAAVLAAVVAIAPVWSLRLLPQGTWTEVSPDWVAAGQWLNEHAAGTRSLVVPASSFARQDWGWTRDEPIQAVTDVNFAVRDAVPLVAPETIRGLDGQVYALDGEALRSLGVGAIIVRHDLEAAPDTPQLGAPTARFGAVEIHLLEGSRDMMLTSFAPVRVDGGGEVLALLYKERGYFPATLTGDNPTIITDTPALAARNYGTLRSPLSAHLYDLAEGADVRNRLKDYPSSGTPVAVTQVGQARASSSAADATAFGGANPSASLTAAFDGLAETAWWPAPGDEEAWIETSVEGSSISITATEDTTVVLSDDSSQRSISLVGAEARSIRVHGDLARITLTGRVGITQIDSGVSRIVEVPGTAENYFFQRIFPATQLIHRRFTTDTPATWEFSAPATVDGEPVEGTAYLEAGAHEVLSTAETLSISRTVFEPPAWTAFNGHVDARENEQIIVTTRGFNAGLRGSIDDTTLEPTLIDAHMQGFRVPPGVGGEFTMTFAGERPYRLSLAAGGALSFLTFVGCTILGLCGLRRRECFAHPGPGERTWSASLAAVGVGLVPGALAFTAVWAIRRFTLIPSWLIAGGSTVFMGLWLARAPWPQENYAGSSFLVLIAGCAALAALSWPDGDGL